MPSTPKPTVVNEVIDPIGDRTAISQRKKVIPIDMGVLSFCLPFRPIILKIANELLFLTIDGDDRIALLLKGATGAVDVFKLGVWIGMRGSLDAFLSPVKKTPAHARFLPML